jgi:hypothetical protein
MIKAFDDDGHRLCDLSLPTKQPCSLLSLRARSAVQRAVNGQTTVLDLNVCNVVVVCACVCVLENQQSLARCIELRHGR